MPSTDIGQSNARVIEYAACSARASGQDRRQATSGASVIPICNRLWWFIPKRVGDRHSEMFQ